MSTTGKILVCLDSYMKRLPARAPLAHVEPFPFTLIAWKVAEYKLVSYRLTKDLLKPGGEPDVLQTRRR